MANKMMPSFDYGAVDCMHELLFNRTYLGQVDQVWNLTIYETQPYVSRCLNHRSVFLLLF
ncbi:unnamed protein product [Haemonchus placei]|uniref:Sm domain-containing protein n=1 Tax=Haemonchus placei TaxID=6290 RepID=A0A0N4W030_HAEPC|nr:unnamed protein product [Haemonchus placei]